MRRFRLPATTLVSRFAILSLLAISIFTGVQVLVQWWILRSDLLDWERLNTAVAVQSEAKAHLTAEDFARWQTPAARERFDAFFRSTLSDPDISAVRLYDGSRRIVWADDPRLLGQQVDGDASVMRALRGEVVTALLSRGSRRIELHIPLSFTRGTPGTAAVAGVAHIAKDPARLLPNLARDRWTILATSLAGAAVLYTVLFGLVLRASRQLSAQHRGLERQAVALREARHDLRATQEQLRVSERLAAVGELSAGVAHGIRNPLANIRASAELALDTPEDARLAKRSLGTIVTEVDRLSRWLTSLLNVARPFEPRLATVKLDDVVRALVALFDERCTARGIRLRTELAAALPEVAADSPQLEQALSSIVENAVDAVPSAGTIVLATAAIVENGRTAVRLTVSDDGPGIPPEAVGRVFEPFFTTKARGTGLGLAVARKIIEAHGGRVAIESAVGRGTTVTIVLPA